MRFKYYLWKFFKIDSWQHIYRKKEDKFLGIKVIDDQYTTFEIGMFSDNIRALINGHELTYYTKLDHQRSQIVRAKLTSGEYYTMG